jgi:hypothetical protein
MVTIALLLSAVIFTPIFIRHHFLLFKKYVIQEDAVEALFIIILLLIADLLSNIYKKELKKYQQETGRLAQDKSELSSKLTDAFKYIGGVNVQIKEIRSIFCGLGRYPATENAFKADLALFALKLLGIVNADWVMIRIICRDNLRTLKEHFQFRKKGVFTNKGISNKAIVARRSLAGYSIVTCQHDNSMIVVACVFPEKSLAEAEKILIEAIAYQIEMLYFIFVSGQPHEKIPQHKPVTRIQKKLTS